MTLAVRDEKERTLLRAEEEVAVEAARAERRRRPAMWAGFRPAILRSTSTIVKRVGGEKTEESGKGGSWERSGVLFHR